MFLLVSGRHVGAYPDGHQHGVSIPNLYKFREKASPHILRKKSCCDLNFGESLCIVTVFLFSDSGLDLLSGFDFILIYFEWRDTEKQQFNHGKVSLKSPICRGDSKFMISRKDRKACAC